MRRSSDLVDGWTLDLDGELPGVGDHTLSIDAVVPGCVHLDLLAAGIVADPYLDRNELDQQWVGERGWTYRLRFVTAAAAPDERADLVFDGIDGVAGVELNGVALGSTANQHRTYRFDVGSLLADGPNELVVRFDSPVAYALAERQRLGDLPNPYGEPYNFIRKMACNFGWDWGPRLTTSGLWKAVRLERWTHARLRSVRPSPRLPAPESIPGEVGHVDVVVDVELEPAAAPGSLGVTVTLRAPGGDVVGRAAAPVGATGSVSLTVDAPDVSRWWPTGRGAQSRYRVEIALSAGELELDRVAHAIGFRDVRIDTSARPDGNTFALWVNGERIWVRGVNWIPLDCFPSRVSGEVLSARLDDAVGANANLVRVWGGGVYESDEFYDHCDERGLLVWQDFPFACAAYPEAALHEEVVAEVADNVVRLMPHPSLAVWCGNNECIEGWWDWGWPAAAGDREWGEGFYRRLLPDMVAALDPGRPYVDASPTSLDPAIHPQDPDRGTVHLWDVWNEFDYEHYRTHRPRFVAEFGFQAPPTFATIEAAVSTRPLTIDDPTLVHHQRALDGSAKLQRALERRFGPVTDFDDWLFDAQLNQANAVTVGVGHFRSLHERCAGVIWWQLDDCWPAISWAVVDGAGRPKPAWYAMRRSFADRLAVFDPTGDELAVVLVNEGRDRWEAEVVFQRVQPDGAIAAAATVSVTVAPSTAERLVVPSAVAPPAKSPDGGPAGDLLVATVGDQRITYDGSVERDRPIMPPRWSVALSFHSATVVVDVTAHTLVRDFCIFADRVDPTARVDDQLVTLLPGEARRFTVTTAGEPDHRAWVDAFAQADGRCAVVRALGDRR